MSDFRVRKLETGHAKIRNVPIAVTPEGFWCCPSPAVLQKTLKNPNHHQKHHKKPPSSQKTPSLPPESLQIDPSNEPESQNNNNPITEPERPIDANPESQPRKISVGFGQPETSDLKLVLYGKEGLAVKMSVHMEILSENSGFFRDKLGGDLPVSCIEMFECDDVEIYVETIGLMYCKDVKNRLIKQNVSRVLRILKVAESLGFNSCIKSCLDYLEAVPWVGEEEEKNVLSSIKNLQICKNNPGKDNNYTTSPYRASPLLRRVSSETTTPPNETLNQIMEMVLKSSDERARREMKTLVLKLLKENSLWTNGSADICTETLYSSCRVCLDSLLDSFKQASEPDFAENPLESREIAFRRINLEADNLLWLVEILSDRNIAEDFIALWAGQDELAKHHASLPIMSRHVASRVTARLFVGIGKGEMLPSKEIKLSLLTVWLKPLMDDYNWLQHGIRSFDRKIVEEGIGRTILTLSLDEQKSILLNWLGCFLRAGDSCPNLQRAFEVWWRRTFIRPYLDQLSGTS